MLLPSAGLQNAAIVANKVRKYIEELKIDAVGHITVSLGVAQVLEGEDMKDSIERADKALYLAKESGRNCVRTELDRKSN